LDDRHCVELEALTVSSPRLSMRQAFGWIGFAVAAIVLISIRLHPSDEISVMLPTGDPVVRDFYHVAEEFRTLESLYIDISTADGEETKVDALFSAGDAIYTRLAESGLFRSIHYKIRPEEYAVLGDLLLNAQASLLTPEDLRELDQRLSSANIPEALTRAKRMLMGATGMFEQDRIRRDPFDLAGLTASKFAELGKRGEGAEILNGAIVTRDHRHLLVFAVPSFPPSDLERGRALISMLEAGRDEIVAQSENDVSIRYAGGHFAYLDNAEVIQRDIKRTSIAVVIGIGLLSFLVFRRPLASVLVLVPAAFGLLVGTSLYTLVNPNIAHVVLGCASLLVGITVDYGIHVLYHEDADQDGSASPKALYLPMLAAAATTIAGFASLLFSRVPGFRDLGAIGIVGIFCSLLFAVWLLPKLATFAPQRRRVLPIPRWVRWAQDWSESHTPLVIAAVVCACVVCAIGARRVHFEGDLRQLNYLSPAHQRDDAGLRAVWEPSVASSVVVSGFTTEDALRENDRLAETLNRLRAEKVIDDFVTVSDILPSQQTQQNRWTGWRTFWSAERIGRSEAETRSVATAMGFAPQAFDEFFARMKAEPRLLTPVDYARSGLDELVSARIADKGKSVLVQTSVFTGDLKSFYRMSDAIRADFPSAVIVNGQAFAEHAKTLILSEMLWLAGWAVVLVGVCLFFAFGAIELVFAVLAPVAISLLFTFGVLGFLGVPLNLISVLFVVFVVGAGDDYSIFLFGSALSAYRGQDTHDENTGASVVLCALTTLFGFGALLLAEHPALRTIGITASIGILSCLFTCFAVSPLMVSFFLPAGGRYGIVTWRGALRAAWTLFGLAGRTFIYVTLIRSWHSLLGEKDPLARGRRARAYIRNMFGAHLARFPYHRNENVSVSDDSFPFDQPKIVVANHQSLFDIVRLSTLPTELVAVVKKWVIQTPLMGALLRDAGYISTEEGRHQETLDRCRDALDQGVSVLFFPEGTRSPDGQLRRFHLGAFELASQSNYELLPVLLSNTRSCIRRKGFVIGEFSSVIHIFPRVTRASFDYSLGAKALMRHVRGVMEEGRAADWSVSQSDAKFWRRLAEGYRYQGLVPRIAVARARRKDPLLAELDSLVPAQGRILDVHCGIGLGSRLLAIKSISRQVVGADWDDRKLSVARSASQDERNLTFEKLPLATPVSTPFDGILLIEGLSSMPEGVLEAMVSWCASSLAADGQIVLRALEPSRRGHGFGRRKLAAERDAEAYRALLSKFGFVVSADHPELARTGEFVWTITRGGV